MISDDVHASVRQMPSRCLGGFTHDRLIVQKFECCTILKHFAGVTISLAWRPGGPSGQARGPDLHRSASETREISSNQSVGQGRRFSNAESLGTSVDMGDEGKDESLRLGAPVDEGLLTSANSRKLT